MIRIALRERFKIDLIRTIGEERAFEMVKHTLANKIADHIIDLIDKSESSIIETDCWSTNEREYRIDFYIGNGNDI